MGRKLKGTRRRGDKIQAFVKVAGKFHSEYFDLDVLPSKVEAWREATRLEFGGAVIADGSFEADVEIYLARPEVAAMPSAKDYRRSLTLWLDALGRERPRASITRDEIEAVLQKWLRLLKEPTVYHRRTPLLSLYTTLDGENAANPVRGTTCPRAWIPRDQSVAFDTLVRIIDAMPDVRYLKKGITQQAAAKLVARVLLHTGVRPVDLAGVRRSDVNWRAATVEMPASEKGQGVAAWTLHLTEAALEAFRAFDAAGIYGGYCEAAVAHSFKRAAKRIDGAETPIHLYSLRHSVGADLYRETKDLATVGRLLGHAPDSRVTAQYARGANHDVDRAAVAALGAVRAAATAPVQKRSRKLPRKLPRTVKVMKLKHLAGG